MEGDSRGTTKLREFSQTLGGRHKAVTNCSQTGSSWNLFTPANKAVAKLSTRHVVFLPDAAWWEMEPAKTHHIPTSVQSGGMDATARQAHDAVDLTAVARQKLSNIF